MTTLSGRTQTALLVIDVQNGVVEGAYRRDQVITNVEAAVAKARAANLPVIWVQHSDEEMPIDSDAWQIVSELIPLSGESMVRKTFRSSFEGTNLAEMLESLAVGRLIVCGAQSNNCIRHTAQDAIAKGYDVTLIADAHTTTSYEWGGHSVSAQAVVEEQNDNFNEDLPGRKAEAVPLAKLSL
ncbi:isochorismatase family protein [Rhodoluna sp.]|uniref:isochorismatase family protein n=1 Tax=Rhodoluna sp. TaxID=1969481 RepID=UPI0025CEDDE8|nr:isochorismatase family protein [Rhodoluna sp.]